jgi:hypothetical protein
MCRARAMLHLRQFIPIGTVGPPNPRDCHEFYRNQVAPALHPLPQMRRVSAWPRVRTARSQLGMFAFSIRKGSEAAGDEELAHHSEEVVWFFEVHQMSCVG